MSGGEDIRRQSQDGDEGSQCADEAGADLSGPQEALTDDFEVEVSRINAASDSPLPSDPGQSTSLPSVPRALPFDARRSLRRRAIATLSAGGAVLLALVVVLTTLPGASSTLRAALGFAPATPAAPLAPNDDTVLVADTVPWGSLTVDGRVTDVATDASTGFALLPRLARGTHTLVYTAAPFPTMRCRLSVPPALSDTCLHANVVLTAHENSGPPRVVDLLATPDHLPSDQYAALGHAIEAALAVPDGTLQQGDHYLAGTGKTVTASSPLTAHLVVTLPARSVQPVNVSGTICDPLCTFDVGNSIAGTPFPASSWLVGAIMSFQWQFAASGGSVVDTSTPPDADGHLFLFQVAWSQSWAAAPVPADAVQRNLCGPAEDEVQQLVGAASNGGQSGGMLWDNNASEGCLIQVSASGAGGSATPAAGETWTVLARFGALIAGDSVTEHALPQLPAASANERAIIARIRAQQ